MNRVNNSLILLTLAGLLFSQDMPVPISVQYPLFLKILSFDENMERDTQEPIRMTVVYQSNFKRSLSVKEEIERQVQMAGIYGLRDRPLELTHIDLDTEDLAAEFEKQHPDLLYVAPLRAFEIKEICTLSRDMEILSLTGVPEYIEEGLSVGLDVKANKPQIIVNLKASKKEGAQLGSQLLKLAKIVD